LREVSFFQVWELGEAKLELAIKLDLLWLNDSYSPSPLGEGSGG